MDLFLVVCFKILAMVCFTIGIVRAFSGKDITDVLLMHVLGFCLLIYSHVIDK